MNKNTLIYFHNELVTFWWIYLAIQLISISLTLLLVFINDFFYQSFNQWSIHKIEIQLWLPNFIIVVTCLLFRATFLELWYISWRLSDVTWKKQTVEINIQMQLINSLWLTTSYINRFDWSPEYFSEPKRRIYGQPFSVPEDLLKQEKTITV